jgi:hypothetical protein
VHRVAVAGLDLVVVDANHERLSSLGDAETCARLSFRTKDREVLYAVTWPEKWRIYQ